MKTVIIATGHGSIRRVFGLTLMPLYLVREAATNDEVMALLASEPHPDLIIWPNRKMDDGVSADGIRRAREAGYTGPMVVCSDAATQGSPYRELQLEAGGPGTFYIEKFSILKGVRRLVPPALNHAAVP